MKYMSVCETLFTFAHWEDWIAWAIFYFLGVWKMIELFPKLARWIERGIQS